MQRLWTNGPARPSLPVPARPRSYPARRRRRRRRRRSNNSEPHELAPCAGGHEVDAHALKAHGSRGCGDPAPTPHPQPVPTPDPGPTVVDTTTTTVTTTTATSTTTGQQTPPAEPGSTPAHGESNGEIASSSSGPGDTQGVVSATQRIGHAAAAAVHRRKALGRGLAGRDADRHG